VLKISHPNWKFENAEKIRLNTILKTSLNTITGLDVFDTAYEENYIQMQTMDATPLSLKLVHANGMRLERYVVDFTDQPDIKFDLTGMNDLIPNYINCIENVS